MRRLLRIAFALIIANGLAAVIVWACGPDYTPLPTVSTLEPADQKAFDRGEIGIVRPRFRRATLAMAYRVFNSQPPLRVTYPPATAPSTSPEDEWRKIRETILGPTTGARGRTRRIANYVTPINCLDDAFATAVRTFAERRQRYGADSALLTAWVSAQAAVFANCDEEPLSLPEPAADTADALTKADRAYQTAAAYFYAMQYDESARRFRAIANDASSPWRPYGRYLAARSILRTATMAADSADQKPATLAAAEKELQAVIADPIAAPVQASARGLLTFVGIRLRPFEELRSLSARIASTPDEVSWAALDDLTYLLDHQIGDTVDYDATAIPQLELLRASHDLVDWIVTMQGREPSARVRAIARWQETRSMPWLVAALSQLRGADDSADALLEAAAAVPASSPSFATVSFLRVRLLIDLGRVDAARKVLAGLPDTTGPQVLPETINLYRGERLMVASTLEEFLKAAPRQSLAVMTPYGIDFKPIIGFDEDAGVALDQRWPLDRLIDAGLSETLPERLRTRVAIAAFTRAIVLNRYDAARRIVPALRTLAPDLAADLDRYMRETTDAGRTRAAVLLILRTPGMTTDVRGLDDYYSWDKVEPRREFESFVPTWWCGKYPEVKQPPPGEAESELIHELYVDHIVPYPSFITTAERAAVEQELAALDAIGHATKYLATAALDWARERPTDPEAAEALARIVAGWRRTCRSADDVELSRRSFQVLHKQFPRSGWAERTKYLVPLIRSRRPRQISMADDLRLRELMREYQSGRFEAFDEIYASIAPGLRRYLLSQARDGAKADDLVQETFLQMHRARHTYDSSYPLMPWAMAIARHVWLMDCRTRSRRPRATDDVTEMELPVKAESASLADRLEVRRALGQVAPARRQAVIQHHVLGFSFKEIAERAGIAETAAKLRSSRGMAQLRALLKGSGSK